MRVDGDKQPSTSSNGINNNVSDGDGALEKITKYLSQKLQLSTTDEDNDEIEKSKGKILSELNIDGIVNYINENGCKKIITMAGAGISTGK